MKSVDLLDDSRGHDEVFRTERLWVRRWRPQDEATLLDVYGKRDVVRWVDDGQPLSSDEARQWMKVTRANYAKYGYGMYAVGGLSGTKAFGFGGLVHPGKQVDAEVKYAFMAKFWGQGFATEFVQGLVNYANHVHQLTRIIATVAQGNLPSQRVLIKCGFHNSGTRMEDDGSKTEIFVWSA